MRVAKALYVFFPLSVLACGNTGPYAPTTSDKNYDDPDDPGTVGQNDPTKDASVGDASGRFCVADRDCPADFRCSYAIAKGCSAAGACLPFVQSTCVNQAGCGCDGVTVTYCLPAGSAPKALKSPTACDVTDAAADSSGDASTTDAAAD